METEVPVFNAQARGSGEDLKRELRRIDGVGYKAYNDVLGGWSCLYWLCFWGCRSWSGSWSGWSLPHTTVPLLRSVLVLPHVPLIGGS